MTTDTTVLSTSEAPSPVGAYTQGRRIGPFLQTSGQLGLAANADTIVAQTRVALARVTAVLAAGDMDWSHVLTVRAYLAADELFDEFDSVYAELVPQPYPARITVSAGLAPGALVEIDALAVAD